MTDLLDRPPPADPAEPPTPGPARSEAPAIGARAALAGTAATVVGVIIDAIAHAGDPALAGTEGILEGAGPGHVLVLAGAVTAAIGLVLVALAPQRSGESGARRAVAFAAPAAVIALLAAAWLWGSGSPATESVTAGGTGAEHSHADPSATGPMTSEPTGSGGHVHGEGPAVALDEATQKTVSSQLAAAREATMRYPTVADAEAAGLKRVGLYAPGSGAHYYDEKVVREPFEPSRPTMWLYAGNEPTSPVVGLMYYALAVEQPPEGFAGPNDHWHQHTGLCLKTGPDGARELPLPVDRDATEADCKAVEGNFINTTGWMIHVWTAPGWESPQGVFSHDHPLLVCADGKTAAEAQLHVGCKGMA